MELDDIHAIIAKNINSKIHIYCFNNITADDMLIGSMIKNKEFAQVIAELQDILEKLNIQAIEVDVADIEMSSWMSRTEFERAYRLDWTTADNEFHRYHSSTNTGDKPPKELDILLKSLDRNTKRKIETIINPKFLSEDDIKYNYNVDLKSTKQKSGFNHHYVRI